jgi:anti-sigma regulatory factor (Ser/Thr protein kinase)
MDFETKAFPALLTNLEKANEFVESCADRYPFDAKKILSILLVLEEAFVNICSYAYPDGAGDAEISCGSDDGAFVLEIADAGLPFDILSLPTPDITLELKDRPIGGL